MAELEKVSKIYPSGRTTITALDETSLKIKRNGFTMIVGPSGSGKTTLLSLLGCVIYPSGGRLLINGKDVTRMNSKQLADMRLRNIGFIFQNFNLITPLTAWQNVLLPLHLMGIKGKTASARAEEALGLVNMLHRKNSLPKLLSGGEQQRVAIARALVTNPAMLLCDEPTSSLDSESAHVIMEELKQQSRSGKAVVLVTHDIRLLPYADDIIYIKDGKIQLEKQ
ncbi:MAG: ABC transporter ATP-binding protein [Thermoflavifilum sp.]|nr:ABC transporter ATP-binding protein [Thermoflavifilum sp.]